LLVIVELSVLLFAGVIAVIGALSNAGAAHPLTENISVLGFHLTGSTGTLFLFGIVVGAVALLALSVIWTGAPRTAERLRATHAAHIDGTGL
jgi:hypothetical protein